MKEYVAKLYVVVFKFLVAMMTKWSKSSINRLLRSFDSDFFKDEIEEKKTKIRDLERRLDRQASLAVQRSIKEVPTQDQIANIIATAQAKFDANFWQKAERYQRGLGEAMVKTLQEQYLSALWTQREELDRQRTSPLPQTISRQPSPMSEASNDTRNALEQIQLNASRFVPQYTHQNHVASLIEQGQDLNVNIEIFDRIKRWNASPVSRILWIQGPFQVSMPSRYTLLSAYVVATAQRAAIPMVYYFCDPSTDAVDLTYNIIGQLIQTAAGDVPSELDFTTARFSRLDGTAASLRDAISLIGDLLTLSPYILFVVIDGLQIIETASNRAILAKLINTLRSAGTQRNAGSLRVFKVLITTDGFTDVLTSLKFDERLDALDLAGEDGAGPEADGIEMGFF